MMDNMVFLVVEVEFGHQLTFDDTVKYCRFERLSAREADFRSQTWYKLHLPENGLNKQLSCLRMFELG